MNPNSALNSSVTERRQTVNRWSLVFLGFLATLSLFLVCLCLVGVVDLALRLLDQPPFFASQVWSCPVAAVPVAAVPVAPVPVAAVPVAAVPVAAVPVAPVPVAPVPVAPVPVAPKPSFAGLEVHGSKIVFILDKSGSMGGTNGSRDEGPDGARNNWLDLRAEIERVLVALSKEQLFALCLYDSESFFNPKNGMLVADKMTIENTMDWFDRHSPLGGTDPVPSLVHAFTSLHPDTIILMSDGMFNNREEVLAKIDELNAEKRVRIYTVSFPGGNEDVRLMMQKIATENGGIWKDYIVGSRGHVP